MLNLAGDYYPQPPMDRAISQILAYRKVDVSIEVEHVANLAIDAKGSTPLIHRHCGEFD